MQICFRCSADLIQPSFHLFCDVVISWSVSINTAQLSLFFDLHCGFTCLYDSVTFWIRMYVRFTSASWRLKLLKSKFECCPVFQLWQILIPWNSDEFLSRQPSELKSYFSPLWFTRRSSSNSLYAYFPRFVLGRAKLSSQKLSLIEHFRYIRIHPWLRGLGNKTKEKKCIIYYWASRQVFFFVLFPQASQPSMKFNISGLVYCVRREENAT